MQAIPNQLAASLPEASVRLNTPVTAVTADSIRLKSGEDVPCRAVVLATDAPAAHALLGSNDTTEWLGTTTLYYAAESSPVDEAILVLDGEGTGPVNHLCVLSDAQPSYAPRGSALISASVMGVPSQTDEDLDARVRAQLRDWYGDIVESWRMLRVDRIPRALPRLTKRLESVERDDGLFVCGDHVATPSIQGTLESGRRTADRIEARLGALNS